MDADAREMGKRQLCVAVVASVTDYLKNQISPNARRHGRFQAPSLGNGTQCRRAGLPVL
jgi:hypothetical protein